MQPLLKSSPEILEHKSNLAVFDKFLAVAEEFGIYVREVEGIDGVIIHPGEYDTLAAKFSSLPMHVQVRKFQQFLSYYEFCRELVASGVSLKDKKASFKAFLRKYGLSLPKENEVLDCLDSLTYIEAYDLDFIQCYRSIDFLNATSHSLMALETCEWWDLFDRSPRINEEIMRVVQSVYSGAIKESIYLPIESHTVKEKGCPSPLSSQTDIIVYSPFYDEEGIFQGGMQAFKVNSVYRLNFKVWN